MFLRDRSSPPGPALGGQPAGLTPMERAPGDTRGLAAERGIPRATCTPARRYDGGSRAVLTVFPFTGEVRRKRRQRVTEDENMCSCIYRADILMS
ncbi:hypothetical protein MTO96_016805 [Rhipicephalus appendiculatus]